MNIKQSIQFYCCKTVKLILCKILLLSILSKTLFNQCDRTLKYSQSHGGESSVFITDEKGAWNLWGSCSKRLKAAEEEEGPRNQEQ